MNRIKIVCSIVVMFISGIILGTFYSNDKEKQKIIIQSDDLIRMLDIPENVSNEKDTDIVDYGNKMLYGEWLAKEIAGKNESLESTDVSDVIGESFSFSDNECKFIYDNEEICIQEPTYEIVTIPIDKQTTYFPNMPTLKEIGIKGVYVTLFKVRGYDLYFILKDDRTVVMFYKNTYIKLERMEYIRNHDFYNNPF
jgi:hypothetical protein